MSSERRVMIGPHGSIRGTLSSKRKQGAKRITSRKVLKMLVIYNYAEPVVIGGRVESVKSCRVCFLKCLGVQPYSKINNIYILITYFFIQIINVVE